MPAEPVPGSLPEPHRNRLLREVDWRFLLPGEKARRAVDLGPGADSEALRLVSTAATAEPGGADLAVTGFPSPAALRSAKRALAPGGEVVCRWRLPCPAAPRRARRGLEAAGFTGVRVYWAGPLPHRLPQFWLPLDSPGAATHLMALRPARTATQRLVRGLWRLAAAAGLLAPLCAIARAPGPASAAGSATGEVADLDAALPASTTLLLLTGGRRSINKVVGLAIEEGEKEPALAVKFARVADAEVGLEHEADILGLLGEERPDLAGVPRLRARGRRGGMLAVAESPIAGEPMLATLTPANFGEMARRVTALLVDLAGSAEPFAESEWRQRFVDEPLARFERSFGPALEPGVVEVARRLLDGIGDLSIVCEHRDCSPWNVVLDPAGVPALLDWESAEPRGLPGLDLVYFLANGAFVLDGALESGRTRESYARLFDPAHAHGRVAAAAVEQYCAATGLDTEAFRRLRALCWIVHSHSDYLHLEMEVAGAPSHEALRGATFLALLEEELGRGGGAATPPWRR
jgi:Phosphotransferase enzyme family